MSNFQQGIINVQVRPSPQAISPTSLARNCLALNDRQLGKEGVGLEIASCNLPFGLPAVATLRHPWLRGGRGQLGALWCPRPEVLRAYLIIGHSLLVIGN